MSVPNVADVSGPLPGTSVVPAVPALSPAPVPAAVPPPAVLTPAPAPVQPLPPPASITDPTANFLPASPEAVAQQNVQQTQQLGQQQVQTAQEKTELDQQQAAEKQKFDEAHAQALEQFLKQQELHRQAADAEISAKRDAYTQQPFTNLFQRQSTGRKVATALLLLAGGISWNSNHTNRAVQMLQDAEQEDLALQKENHADLWRDLQLSLDNRKELDSRQLHDLSDWQAKEAAKWTAVSSKLNSLIAANKGRGDVSAAQAAAIEATTKANQAWENARTSKATANHLDAQSELAKQEALTQPSVREKNLAEAENARALAANGGLDKLSQAMLQRFPTMIQRDQDVKALYGNDATPGPLRVLPRVAELQQNFKDSIANHDDQKLLQTVIATKELASKLLTGGQLNETKAHVLDQLQGKPDEVQAKLSRILGDPKASEQLAKGLYGLLDDIREQGLKVTDDSRSRLHKKYLGPSSPYARNPALKSAVQEQVEALTSEVKNGGGQPRYPEGGAAPVQAAPVKSQYPVGTKATSGGKPVTWDGTKWVPGG